MKNKILILILISILFIGCNSQGRVKQDLITLQSSSIKMPINAIITYNGVDSLIPDYFHSDYKLIIYTDSISCSSCAINRLFLWNDFIKYAEPYNGRIKLYFIFNPPASDNIRIALQGSDLNYPMLLDSLGEFERLNPHLPKNKAMHTFLLDENNNVVLVGSPLHNPKIEQMFKDIVEDKLGKKE